MAAIKSDHERICAISEDAINENFKTLFDQQPQVARVVYDDPQVEGMMDAILLPPKIKLRMGNGDKLELSLTFM